MAKTYLPEGIGATFKNIIKFVGNTPLDGRSVVDTFTDISGDNYKSLFTHDDVVSYYPGMLVVTKDTGKLYVLSSDGLFKEVTPDNILGSLSVNYYNTGEPNAVSLATNANVGQIIYVKNNVYEHKDSTNETPLETTDVSLAKTKDGSPIIKYGIAPYIVIGAGTLQKLESTTASGDIASEIAALVTRVNAIEESYQSEDQRIEALVKALSDKFGNEESGFVKDVNDLKTSVGDINTELEGLSDTYAKKADVYTKDAADEKFVEANDTTYANIVNTVNSLSENYASKEVVDGLSGKIGSEESGIVKDINDLQTATTNLANDKADKSTVYNKEETEQKFTISNVKSTNSETGITSYTISQGSTNVVTIDIPKDLMVQSGEIVDLEEGAAGVGKPAGSYIKLVLNSSTADPIYIPVNELVDIYEAAEQSYITVSGYKIGLDYAGLKSKLSEDLKGTFYEKSKLESDQATLKSAITSEYTAAINSAKQELTTAYTEADKAFVTKESFGTYEEGINGQLQSIGKDIESINTKNGTQDELIQANADNISEISSTVLSQGEEITGIKVILNGEGEQQGLVTKVSSLEELSANIKNVTDNAITKIIVNDEFTASNGVVTLNVASDLSSDANALVVVSTVKDAIEEKAVVVVTEDSTTIGNPSVKNIYIEGTDTNGYVGKVFVNDKWFTLGENKYVGKEEFVSDTQNGIMKSEDYKLLHDIGALTSDEINAVLV
jgi:hypothetical protein